MRIIALVITSLFLATSAMAQSIAPRDGWAIFASSKTYTQLIADVKKAAKSHGLVVVTQAGPTGAAKQRGIIIPGNRVIGLFNNDYAVRVLNLSVVAMIEAPIRIYVTEEADGTATLSYKTPSHVFAPYAQDGGEDLARIAAELDATFAAIAQDAAQ